MYRLLAILAFYKQLIAWSFVANVIIAFINPQLTPALITKLFLTVFAWYYFNESSKKQKLTFYNNLGISSFVLFFLVFVVDCILTLIFLTIFKEFT